MAHTNKFSSWLPKIEVQKYAKKKLKANNTHTFTYAVRHHSKECTQSKCVDIQYFIFDNSQPNNDSFNHRKKKLVG